MMMNSMRTSLARALQKTRSLPITSTFRSNYYTLIPLVQSQTSPKSCLPYNLGFPYSFRDFSDSTTVHHDNARPETEQRDYNHKEGEEDIKDTENDGHDIKDEQARVLEAALGHVPKFGWTEAAMVAGARDLGISPSIVGAFPRKEAALVEYFMDVCLQRLQDEIESCKEELSNMVLHDRIVKLIRLRLEMQAPYISKWPQALSIQANPLNLPTSFKQRAILVDEIWHAAGDRSTDVDWYAKRTLLGGVYAATELYMLTDYSPEFRDTWLFLDNRTRDVLDCRKTAQEAAQLVTAIGAGLSNTFQSFLRKQH